MYPKDLQQRARVNELMDWLNTALCRDFGYGLVYPQIFPRHKRRSDEAQEATLQWGKERARVLVEGPRRPLPRRGQRHPLRRRMTIADYYAAGFVALGESSAAATSAPTRTSSAGSAA